MIKWFQLLWTLYDSFTGTTLIAAVNTNWNCVTIENNSLQYIWAKVRAVKAIGQTNSSDKSSDDTENGEVNNKKHNSRELNEAENDSTDDDETGNEQIDE